MLEHVPHWLGELLRERRAGHAKLVAASLPAGLARLSLASTAFADGGRLPVRFTADGAGMSPPLHWHGVPSEARSLALIVEDPDAPFGEPLVHAIVWNMPPSDDCLAEGAIKADGAGSAEGDVGRNSFLREGWLPPDPPTGHGRHDYVFQLLALSDTRALPPTPGRGALLDAIAGHVLAVGVLTGSYSREEPAGVGPVGAATAA